MNRIIYKERSDKLLYICISFTLIYVVMKKIIIAIDGVSSTGKSTMAKDLARELGYTYIDTGAMYRAVTLYSLQHGFFTSGGIDEQKLQDAMNDIDISFRFNPETGRPDTYLNGVKVEKEIRGMEVANRVSPIAALGFVRRAMVAKQQEMGKAKGIVMDRQRGAGRTAAEDGRRQGHRDGWSRYRYGCLSGCGTEDLCDSQPGSACPTAFGRTESQRRGCFF